MTALVVWPYQRLVRTHPINHAQSCYVGVYEPSEISHIKKKKWLLWLESPHVWYHLLITELSCNHFCKNKKPYE